MAEEKVDVRLNTHHFALKLTKVKPSLSGMMKICVETEMGIVKCVKCGDVDVLIFFDPSYIFHMSGDDFASAYSRAKWRLLRKG